MTGIVDAAGYSSYWIDFAEAFCSGSITELSIPSDSKKTCDAMRYEFYVFRAAAKETYPELVSIKACINNVEGDKFELFFSNRDNSKGSYLLRDALEKAGALRIVRSSPENEK